MKKAILHLFLFLGLLPLSCKNKYEKAEEEITKNAPLDSKNMNVGDQNYSLAVPEGWTTSHMVVSGINNYMLLAPKTAEDPNTNINLITESMQNLSLADYEAKSIKYLKQSIPSVVILDKGEISAGNIKGMWYSYTMTPGEVEASLVMYTFPKNGVAYNITGGTQLKDAARYRKIFDAVATSLKFDR